MTDSLFFRTVIQQEAKRSALIVPSSANVSMERSHSQSTEMADSTSKSMQVPVRGSFLRRKKDLHVEVEDPKPSPKITETYARSSKKAAKKQSAATPPRVSSSCVCAPKLAPHCAKIRVGLSCTNCTIVPKWHNFGTSPFLNVFPPITFL